MTNQIFVNTNAPADDRDAKALKDIWNLYAHEATEFDHLCIDSLHKSLDIRLIFVRSCLPQLFLIAVCLDGYI